MSLFVFLGIFLFLPKSHGDGGMVTAAGVGWRWESLAMILNVSGTSKMVVCELSGVKFTLGPAGMAGQHYLGIALPTSLEEGPRKGGLNKAHPLCPYQLTAVGWASNIAVGIK